MKPLTRKRLSCWLIFYALSLAAILAAAGLLALLAGVSNWVTIGLAVWLMLCLPACASRITSGTVGCRRRARKKLPSVKTEGSFSA